MVFIRTPNRFCGSPWSRCFNIQWFRVSIHCMYWLQQFILNNLNKAVLNDASYYYIFFVFVKNIHASYYTELFLFISLFKFQVFFWYSLTLTKPDCCIKYVIYYNFIEMITVVILICHENVKTNGNLIIHLLFEHIQWSICRRTLFFFKVSFLSSNVQSR